MSSNENNVKQASRLTGSLLARKGIAKPSQATLAMHQQVVNRFAEADPGEISVNQSNGVKSQASLESAIEAVKGVADHQSSQKSNVRKKDVPVKKRIAMTLRMEQEDHLKLRIYSAHTRKSCQVILSEALNLFLEQNNEIVAVSNVASGQK